MLYDKDSPSSIAEMFSSIAADYDRANALASLGLHTFWNRALIKAILRRRTPQVHLDLCCGTGAIGVPLACRARKHLRKLHLLDFSLPMLEKALHRGLQRGLDPTQIELHWANAEEIPLPSSTVDSVTIAYGIRNVQNPARLFAEVHRVLKPGGLFGLLELTRPTNPLFSHLHQLFLTKGLPLLTSLASKNGAAYSYLSRSIQDFMPLSALQLLLQSEQLHPLSHKPLLWGTATLLLSSKT